MEWRYNAKWCAWTFEKYTQMVKREKQNKKKSVYYMGSWAELSYWIPEFFHAGGLHKVSKRPNHTVLLRQEKKQKKFFFQPHVGVYPDFFVFPFNRIIYFVNLPSFLYFVFLFYSFFLRGKNILFLSYICCLKNLFIFSPIICVYLSYRYRHLSTQKQFPSSFYVFLHLYHTLQFKKLDPLKKSGGRRCCCCCWGGE